jgi:hypothetical protein
LSYGKALERLDLRAEYGEDRYRVAPALRRTGGADVGVPISTASMNGDDRRGIINVYP